MSDPGERDVGGADSGTAEPGQAEIYQAGRDLHIHYPASVHRLAVGRSGMDVAPYPGLASFTEDQAAQFFGRERLTAELVDRLDASLAGGGPVMVVAASGAGKSSLLRAGLLPRIAAGALSPAGSRRWPRVVFMPGAHPMSAAAVALLAALPAGRDASVPPDPRAGDLDSLLAAVVAAAGPGTRAVLVIDQFEELFRLCEDEDERGAFISWLWKAASGGVPGGPVAVVACAVRADFYPECTAYPQIRHALQHNQVIVGAMSPEELRQAIIFPAAAAGLDIEPGLTELLLADLHAGHPAAAGKESRAADDGTGRLPLLAHALRATWQQRHGSTLTVAGYRATGGIEHAIADTAERVFAHLDIGAQQEARRLFLRLVKIGGDSGEDIRRLVLRQDLTGDSENGAAVIHAYTDARLLTVSRNGVQITHEALLHAWPRLARWLDDDRAGQLTRQQVEDDANEWDAADRHSSLLYRGARLEAVIVWASSHSPELTATARHFITASQRLARRTKLIQRGLITVLLVAASITSTVAVSEASFAQPEPIAAAAVTTLITALLIAWNVRLHSQLRAQGAWRMAGTRGLERDRRGGSPLPSSEAPQLGRPYTMDAPPIEPPGSYLTDGPAHGPRRYLRAQGPDSVMPGVVFSLVVSVVTSGGDGKPLKDFSVPRGGLPVLIVMHAPGIRVLGSHRQTTVVPVQGNSEPVMFELRAERLGQHPVSIMAFDDGSYLGELTVDVAIERDARTSQDRTMLGEINRGRTDGEVTLVVRFDSAHNAYRFEFRDVDNPAEIQSTLAYDPGRAVGRLLARLDELAESGRGYLPEVAHDYLVNAGLELWEQLIPEPLRRQFWERQDRIKQLTILSEADTVPWELLYPKETGRDAGFLVEQFPVTRAIFGRLPPRSLRLRPARFVLPSGSPEEAATEIQALRALLEPGHSTTEPVATLKPLLNLIREGDFGLLHFACHNRFDPADGSTITLDGPFEPIQLNSAGADRTLSASTPLIFINACRSAGQSPSYNKLDGWADKFLRAGAGAFIGSQWAVRDRAAREFAEELYGKLQAGNELGAAVMAARRAATHLGDPTWLAYAVYGDPQARIAASKI